MGFTCQNDIMPDSGSEDPELTHGSQGQQLICWQVHERRRKNEHDKQAESEDTNVLSDGSHSVASLVDNAGREGREMKSITSFSNKVRIKFN